MRISGKLNLMQLHAIRKMITGAAGPVECLVIPIAKNRLFVGEKGVYLDLIAFEVDPAKRTADSKDTHLIKQSFSKEVRSEIGEEGLKQLPILGNLQVWDGQGESEPTSTMAVQDELSGLPF